MRQVAKKAVLLAGAIVSAALAVPVRAQTHRLEGFHHTAWTAEQGIGAVFDVQQAPNGYLWLTTARGIYRFDGVRFQSIEETTGGAARSKDLDSVYVSPNGDVWMVTRGQGLLLWKNEQLTPFSDRRCTPGRKLDAFAEDKDGSLWIMSSGGLSLLKQGVCSQVGTERGYPGGFVRAFLMDSRGTLWVKAPSGDLLVMRRGERMFQKSQYGQGANGDFNFLHEAPDGSVWLADALGLRRVSGGNSKPPAPSRWNGKSHAVSDFGNFIFSADGALWASIGKGIARFPHAAELPIDTPLDLSTGEAFTKADGLSSDVVSKLTPDREGSMWLATNSGMDQLRRNALSTLSLPPLQDYQIGIAADNRNSVWIGNLGLPLTEITESGVVKTYAQTLQARSVRRDPSGAIWTSGRAGPRLWKVQDGKLEGVSFPTNDVETAPAVAVDKNGELWVSTFEPQVFHRVAGVWQNESKALGRKPGVIGSMLGDDAGNIWFAFSNSLLKWDGKSYQRYALRGGPLSISVTTLAVRGEHVWMGGTGGIVLFRKGEFARLRFKDDDILGRVSGLAETADGELWANGFSGVTHITASELQKWLKDPNYSVDAERFDVLDGLPGLSQERFPEPSMAVTPNGRLYFATTKGVAWVDPHTLHSQRNKVAPPVVVEEVIAGGQLFPATHPITLPAKTSQLEIHYTALSLAIPERVRFRYKLDDVDKQWHEAGTRREAFYNSLRPGHYRFHVIASNNDGVWNEDGASVEVTLAPAYYQTMWFYAMCAALLLGLLYLLYLVRVRHITAEMRRRMNERSGERVRIARELHDTLLQTIHALMLRFHFAVEALPESEPARELLVQSLARADGAIVETRQRVQDLRSASMQLLPFAGMVERMADDLRSEDLPAFRVTVDGPLRTFAPLVQDELCHIAQESITNAFRHAEATTMEVELSYGLSAFRMICRDNGRGILPDVLASGGRDGHWGLVGMRERSKLIGGTFEINSVVGSGTEVVVRIPALRAYATPGGHRLWARLTGRFRSSTESE